MELEPNYIQGLLIEYQVSLSLIYILDGELVQVTEEGYEKILIQIKVMKAEVLLNALLNLSTGSEKRLVQQKSEFGFVQSIDSGHDTQFAFFNAVFLPVYTFTL
jgi:hypothetical protein